MSQFETAYPDGSTPLDPNEMDGLIPDYITTQGELNQLERDNILEAATWARGKKHREILTATFVFSLHRRMLGRVWTRAGTQRTSNKNIGVFKEEIGSSLGALLGDARYWIDHNTYGWDELAARFHHRLVSIHPFVNGNGRHARLLTDILLTSGHQEPFTWGQTTMSDRLDAEGPLRQTYISALKAADAGDYAPLIRFVRT